MSNIQQGLMIAAIGMGLVFAVIIFLWGLMALMMRLTSKQKPISGSAGTFDETTDTLITPELAVVDRQRRSAAAAVAVQLAITTSQKRQYRAKDLRTSSDLSPWQAFHRSRQRENKHK